MSEESIGDKDVPDNDDRPPPLDNRTVQWDFIRFGLRQRSMGARLLDVVYSQRKC